MADNQSNAGRDFLKSFFGFDSFRPNQEEIIKAICRGQDVFAVMPTGGGKSLCYQFPAVVLEGVCVVISPLLSLMKDQVDSANEIGLRAATLNSQTTASRYGATMRLLEQNELDLLYISPERFTNANFLEQLQRFKISFFAVDEAHCISEWGHQFRPNYLELSRIRDLFPAVPIAAFTATATDQVADDIKRQLKLQNPYLVRASFDRPNLDYAVVYKNDLNKQLLDFLETIPKGEPGIVYRETRKKVEETANFLKKKGYSALPYHAGMTPAERNSVQEAFSYDQVQIVVATIAFGMGIDKPNVRFVVHGDLPRNIEGYYQETGRAGRDGAPAQCLLLFGYQDVIIHRSLIEKNEGEFGKQVASQQLQKMIGFAEADECRRKAILRYFGETYPRDYCGHCDYCRGALRHTDATIDAQKALSAVYRTGNSFGMTHLIDILVGAGKERVKFLKHNLLPTFGVGKDEPRSHWKFIFQSLIYQGALMYKPNCDYQVLQLTRFGADILKGEKKFEVVDFAFEIKSKKGNNRGSKKTAKLSQSDLTQRERKLLDLLRYRRSELASEERVRPYLIFNDISLQDMAKQEPVTEENFLKITGVGDRKMKKYGADFIELIIDFRRANPPQES